MKIGRREDLEAFHSSCDVQEQKRREEAESELVELRKELERLRREE